MNIEGIKSLELMKKGNVKLLFSGDINFLLKKLSSYKLSDITIEEPTLEEIFMHYYKEGNSK